MKMRRALSTVAYSFNGEAKEDKKNGGKRKQGRRRKRRKSEEGEEGEEEKEKKTRRICDKSNMNISLLSKGIPGTGIKDNCFVQKMRI